MLAGLWTEGTLADAENSLRELAALAETAGSEVLDGLVQRSAKPDPGTFTGQQLRHRAPVMRWIASAVRGSRPGWWWKFRFCPVCLSA